ncbi:MAG TPA: pantetheine-phosphate adenylyltransferase [Planctomycetota bacterium]|jgi:pantetheine-phosphate adenylyltransferase|nr:pantetheine-phosphate adenylyltransferase [Planctomycetota bacterium]
MGNASKRALYPGTFDPVTLGHLDLIRRGCDLFGRLAVAVAENASKEPVFTVEERVEMLRGETKGLPVEVDSFRGLVVDYCRRRGYGVILRGLRTVSDFEYEFQMALTNRALARDVETVFMMANEKYAYLSSRLIKEVLAAGGDVGGFLTSGVAKAMRDRLEEMERSAGGNRPASKT